MFKMTPSECGVFGENIKSETRQFLDLLCVFFYQFFHLDACKLGYTRIKP